MAGLCLDAEVVRTLSRSTLTRFGTFAYFFAGIQGVLTYRKHTSRLKSFERSITGSFYTIHAGICRFSGGGMSFTPHADPGSGSLAVTTVESKSRLLLLANMYRAYTGTIHRFGSSSHWSTHEIHIESPGANPIAIEADGEFVGYGSVQIKCIADAFRVCVG